METKSTSDKKLMTINLYMNIDYIDIELNRKQLTSTSKSNRHRQNRRQTIDTDIDHGNVKTSTSNRK